MRGLFCLLVLTALACDSIGAQKGTAKSRSGSKTCEDCAQDSSPRLMYRYRTRQRHDVEQLARLARDLAAVRRTLHGGRELSGTERRRMERRASRLESQIAELGASVGLDAAGEALRSMRPAMIGARRAVAAAMAEAGGVAVEAAATEGPRFPGWIGITLDAPCTVEARRGDVYWRFFDHPEIVSVEPSSPAERAGIRQGDVLLAYDGQDVRREIAMNRLLQPGRKVRVSVRARRENEVRDVTVKVAPVHDRAWRDWGSGVAVSRPVKPRSPREPEAPWTVVVPEPAQPTVVGARAATPAPMISIARLDGFAGAHVETITRGLGETIGVDRGVLVISVPPGVPAHESGLVDGDVILRAGGRDVRSVQELRRFVAASAGRAVKLDVTKRGKTRQVMLRW